MNQNTTVAASETQGHPDNQVAIYWDFENVHACVLESQQGKGAYKKSLYKPQEQIIDVSRIVEFAETFGRISVNRAYANWQWFGKYQKQVQAHAMELIQLFPVSGTKNGADIRLAADAIEDLLQQPHITHVLVVAGDSDFIGLAQKCRKLGRAVLAVGGDNSNGRLISAFDDFRYYDQLVEPCPTAAPNQTSTVGEQVDLTPVSALVTAAIRGLAGDGTGPWVKKARLRPAVEQIDPSFAVEKYGFVTFSALLDALGETVTQRAGAGDREIAVSVDLVEQPAWPLVPSFPPPAAVAA